MHTAKLSGGVRELSRDKGRFGWLGGGLGWLGGGIAGFDGWPVGSMMGLVGSVVGLVGSGVGLVSLVVGSMMGSVGCSVGWSVGLAVSLVGLLVGLVGSALGSVIGWVCSVVDWVGSMGLVSIFIVFLYISGMVIKGQKQTAGRGWAGRIRYIFYSTRRCSYSTKTLCRGGLGDVLNGGLSAGSGIAENSGSDQLSPQLVCALALFISRTTSHRQQPYILGKM
jgi:hypothetical protein